MALVTVHASVSAWVLASSDIFQTVNIQLFKFLASTFQRKNLIILSNLFFFFIMSVKVLKINRELLLL